MIKLRLRLADGSHKDVEIDKPKIRIGRDPDCDIQFSLSQYPKVSGLHAELVTKQNQVWLCHRSKSNSTVLNNQPVTKPQTLQPGNRFRLGFTGPEIEFLRLHIEPSSDATQFAGKASDFLLPPSNAVTGFSVTDKTFIGRDRQICTLHLDHAHVSRRHAQLRIQNGQTFILDLGSFNGTFVNGNRISKPTPISGGDVIDIGPYLLEFDGKCLHSRSRSNNIQLDVCHVGREVPDLQTKRPLSLLSDISFTAAPSEFLAIVGPSGSGKSTLLSIISGRSRPSSGRILINQRNLHQNFRAIKEDLVVIPQSSLVHPSLTVRQTIFYAASLRLPVDTQSIEIRQRVDSVLESVGLEEREKTKVRLLSGGQLKRLGLACELISDPSLLFLDEVTSGLDERADGEMMKLFHNLANTGKTIVCITHNLGHIEDYCDKILVLTEGGRLAFFGSTQRVKDYFNIQRLADLYDALEARPAKQWAASFRRSADHTNASSAANDAVAKDPVAEQITFLRNGLRTINQTFVLVRRYTAVWWSDKLALLAIFGQTLLVTGLLCLVFADITPTSDQPQQNFARGTQLRNLLFLVGISCFWLGANNSAKEIIKERLIYQREKDFNLNPEAYWISKLIVLQLLGISQALMLTSSVFFFCNVPGSLLAILATSCILSIVGTNLGLAISANAKSEELSIALVPVAVIPQIILAGVVANLDSAALAISKLTTSTLWGQRLYELALPEAGRLASDFSPPATTSCIVLGIQGLIFMAATWFGLRFVRISER
ncbi:FHA domain-containing protein [Planctomycetaceae bacterium SH139]